MKPILFVLLLCCCHHAYASCVVLLHGLARSQSSMESVESALTEHGYLVVNQSYPSREHPIETLAELAIKPALAECPEGESVSFVTHSLGGILVRQYLSQHRLPNLHRVVMLGPPNQGSEVVDKLGPVPGFYFINGDAGMQLGTGQLSVPNTLGRVHFDLGVIAGTRSVNLILSRLIPSTDDGKVSVARTKIEGMNDHIALPVTHTFMMQNQRVIEQVIHYLDNGQFANEDG